MKTEYKDFEWAKFKRSVSREVYSFVKLNYDGPISEKTFAEIMQSYVEDKIPKFLQQFGEDWHEVYENTKKDYGFWGGSLDGVL